MKVLKHYDSFNKRRYSNPWVAEVNPKTARPDFSSTAGGYTGGYNEGEEGDLYVTDPREGTVYMYGQKDYRGNNTERKYAIYRNDEFAPISNSELIAALSGESSREKVLKHYDSFNKRRYSNPWVAEVDPKTARPDFTSTVGGYTGGYNRGEEGDLYVTAPREGTVYMYGQKDYRGNNTEQKYAIYRNGEFVPITKSKLTTTLKAKQEA